MFGFQRVGDQIWAAADQRARGFLLGATAGRTTLGGEGLQHQDGSSLLLAAQIPNCRAYDPCFAGEFAVILDHGMRQLLEQQQDVFYYVTLMNENYAQPSLPAGCEGDVVRGLYRFADFGVDGSTAGAAVRLLGSGAILREVIAAAGLLRDDWGISSEVWSATSFSELGRDALEVERHNRLHPGQPPRQSHVARHLAGEAPVIAASDFVRAWPQLVAGSFVAPFTVLGTDGFGRSDTRAELRRFFEVDRHHVVLAALDSLARAGHVDPMLCVQAVQRYGIDTEADAPWTR
jgi:pyruvate dehydrogenase E1 component